MITEARHLVDASGADGGAWAWHAGRWLLSLVLALLPLWVGPWHGQQRQAGPPPLELSIVRLPPAAPSAPVQAPPTPPSVTQRPEGVSAEPAPAEPVAQAAPPTPAAQDTPLPEPDAAARPVADPLLAASQPPRPETAAPQRQAAPPAATEPPGEAAPAAPAQPPAPRVPQDAAPPSPERPVDADALDAGFRLLSRGPLTYPSRARRLGRGGEARLEVAVDPTGRVTGVTVLHETRGWGFGDAARAAYAQARFTQPTVNGRPVHVRWRKTLRFQP